MWWNRNFSPSSFGLSKSHGSLVEFSATREIFADCWEALSKPLQNSENHKRLVQLPVFIFWNLWKSRNDLLFLGKSSESNWYCCFCHFFAGWLHFGQHPLFPLGNVNRLVFPAFWFPLPVGSIKLNFDAAVDRQRNKGTISFIFRNCSPSILDWCGKIYPFIENPLVLESLACRDSLLRAVSRDLNYLIGEGDCEVRIKTINSHNSLLVLDSIIADIQNISNGFFFILFNVFEGIIIELLTLLLRKLFTFSLMKLHNSGLKKNSLL